MGGISKKDFIYGLDSRHSVLFAHIFDMAMKADKFPSPVYGDFLSENSISELYRRMQFLPCEPILFGGFDDAERKMVAFVPEYEKPQFPISALKLSFRRTKSLTHRDFLGSVLGLGIKREKCGDIIINDECAYILLADDIISYVKNNLTRVGREGVRGEIVPLSQLEIPQKEFKSITGTVSSLRLDAIISLFAGKGRSKASEMISAGLVFVNGVCAEKSDMRLSDGDVISLRGKGKTTLEIGGMSKKDRVFITLNIRA